MFNENAYLQVYPDVAAAVKAGSFSSGLQHYTQFGQQENRIGFFFGSSGNDTITGFGQGTKVLAGVAFDALLNGSTVAGVGEVDTLIGREGRDVFVLGHPTLSSLTSTPQQFYVGRGNADYALIRNFQRFEDLIVLEGSPQNYNFQVVNGSLNIFRTSGDLVGIVEGVTSLMPVSNDLFDLKTFNVPLNTSGPFSILL
ncbi:hypothetical protein WA1_06050 [Scytonema hofmannii PCC 7110]|uniref:Peptidase M10 serralysin C-terminal domain-containing protein n=1 Tax=Scytonema hofmannii PCC 7110 TaxID=128403 RepID=A0A139WSG6_9CYAN|nr:hypothetical protein [Scytonema hofmannii]KYC35385.1 hypothetical protein WA1_06050 [Scytonema hofmannii PCC 7110]